MHCVQAAVLLVGTLKHTMAGFGNYCLKTSASILTLAAPILRQFQKFKNLVKGPQFCECWKLKFLTLD